jgi:hypothetical protein
MKKKDKIPYISPGNRMDPNNPIMKATKKELKTEEFKPIIEMSDENQIIYMAVQNLVFMNTSHTNFMASIIHHKKAKTIEMRGRMRFEDTGRKTVFSTKDEDIKPYTRANYQKMKWMIKDMPTMLVKETPFKPVEPIYELEFAINEDIDSIIKKLNDSNQFDIGVLPK